MSEQTPNSSGDLGGTEPSMEDILASIRKIISDDEPVALESPEDVPTVNLVDSPTPSGATGELDDLMQGLHMEPNDLTSDAVLDAAVVQPAPYEAEIEAESVDLNIDDVLADLDEEALRADAGDIPVVERVQDDALSVKMDDFVPEASPVEHLQPVEAIIESDGIAPETEDDVLSFLDDEIPLADSLSLDAAPEVAASTAAMAGLARADEVESDDLEMDALLDDILMSPEEDEAEEMFDDMSDNASKSAEDSDLELVKSLMADLADDPEGLDADEDLDALLAIPELEDTPDLEEAASDEADAEFNIEDLAAEAEAAELDGDDDAFFEDILGEADAEPDTTAEVEAEEEDILGDILDMTLEDELESHPEDFSDLDDVLQAEQENLAENALDIEEMSDASPTDDFIADDVPSLSDIAAAAEADAVAAELATAPPVIAATAGLAVVAGGAALGTTALGAAPAKAETETAETYSEPTPEIHSEPTPNQETSMPVKAVQTDAILDEVTETATAGAFAELNQVVEDKAIFSERGPRIGDLVQEALRPMLKEWLDANLKGIVERAVTKEVKRISSGK